MRHFLIMAILTIVSVPITTPPALAVTVIDMPRPPEEAKITQTAPAEAAQAEADPEPDVGDIALARYSSMRQTPSNTYGPAFAWWGWGGYRDRYFAWGFYGYRPHYPNWPDAYCGPGRYGRLTGGYRISISPWSYRSYRNRFGNYVYP